MPPGDRPSLADPATELGAEAFLPAQRTLPALRAAAAGCRGCSLWEKATQTVFGAGPVPAALMLVGEQPGDREDIVGDPFVGPAGRVLDQALAEAGIDRERIFVTNVVKHFKWRPSGKRRLHERPSRAEVRACRPWLEAELGLVQPDVMVLLGATAAQAVMGPDFRVTTSRGRVMPSPMGVPALATIHPSAVLRMAAAEERRAALESLAADLAVAAEASVRRPRERGRSTVPVARR